MSYQPAHIGLVAAGKRNILPGTEFDSLFPHPDMRKTIVDRNGDISDTMVQIGRVLGTYYKDTAKLAPMLKGKSLKETCNNIWDFIFNHIQYELDQPGEEQLRRPARAWADRVTGVDCDCYSIFAGSVLINLNIPFKLRITKYDGKPYYQHVYVVVPAGNGVEYIIDPVLNEFNYEKPFSGMKDYDNASLGIPIAVLHGVENSPTVIDQLLAGVGEVSDEQAIYDHLVATRATIVNNPGIIDSVEYPQGFIQMLDYAIDNYWRGEKIRNKAFEILAANEARINQMMGITHDDLDAINDDNDDYINGFAGVDTVDLVDDDELYPFNGIGELNGKKEREERKKKRQEKKSDKKAERKEEKGERKQERKEAKGFFRKVGVTLKQGGRAFVKFNPVVIAVRNGVLAALRVNFAKLSSRLKWGYATPEQAKASGVSVKRHEASKRALKRVEKIFDDKLQGSSVSLKNAILSGKHNLSGFADDYVDVRGLGEIMSAAAMAAAAPVIVKIIDAVGDEMGAVEKEEGIADIYTDSGMEKTGDEEKKKGWIGKALKSLFGKKETQDALKTVESEDSTDAQKIDADDDGVRTSGFDLKTFSKGVGDFVKSNPLLSAAIAGGIAYVVFPGVRESVNSIFSGGKKSATNGLGSTLPKKASKSKAKSKKKISSITLK